MHVCNPLPSIPPLSASCSPTSSSPGLIAGLLAARYLIPAIVWGTVDERAIRPDSGAKSWAIRREQLTDQYVSRLAAEAGGRTDLEDDDEADIDGQPPLLSEASADARAKNMSGLDPDDLKVGRLRY